MLTKTFLHQQLLPHPGIPFDADYLEPLPLDPHSVRLLTRYTERKVALNRRWRFYLGRSRVATLSRDHDGRSYRQADPALCAEEMRSIREPNVFIVGDVAFIYPEHGMAIADELERRRVRERYYLETRCDVLIRGQTNFLRMLFKFSKVYNAERFHADHAVNDQ